MPKKPLSVTGVFVSQFLLFASVGSIGAQEVPFYQGRTLTVLEGRAPGGRGSLRAQITSKYLQKYLPGNPGFVYQYMDGGGGTAAANHMAHVVRRDGLTIANIGSSLFANALLGAGGVRYKLEDFVFLGSASSGNPFALVVRPGLGLDTVEKLKSYRGLRFANRSVGHTTYIVDRMAAFVLELKDPKWVLGYNDQEITMSLERGEADARMDGISLLTQRSATIKEGYTFPVVIRNTKGRGVEVFETIEGFPKGRHTLDHYADNELKRTLLRFHNAVRPVSAVYLVPKGIPEPALRTLTDAFNKLWKDIQFTEEYERLTGEPADPLNRDEIEQVLRQIPKDPKVLEVYKILIGAGPLPPVR